MNKIDININRAKIKSYQVSLEDDMPSIYATIELYCGDKVVTTMLLTTNKWQTGIFFDVPLSIIDPLLKIAKELEAILIAHTQGTFGQLVAPEGYNVDAENA